LSRSSSHDSLDSLNISDKTQEFGKITNTVRAIEQEGPNKGHSKTFQLPSLITPVSLFGKRIR
jgi:lysophospholipase